MTGNIPEKEGELEEETPDGKIFPDSTPLFHALPQIFPNQVQTGKCCDLGGDADNFNKSSLYG